MKRTTHENALQRLGITTKHLGSAALSVVLAASLTFGVGCAANGTTSASTEATTTATTEAVTSSEVSEATSATTQAASSSLSSDSVLDVTDLFTSRDLEQTADTSNATSYTVSDGQTITITAEGVYVISGTATNAQIRVEADDAAKVQLVLDGLNVTNESAPVIYVVSADKVFVTTTSGSENSLTVTGTFAADGDDTPNAVVYSHDDLVLNGQGTLSISSSDKGVKSKDDLKVTGGTYVVQSTGTAFDANDRLAVSDGTFTVNAGGDGFHAENSDDATLGWIYISGGTFNITAGSDGIQGTSVVEIDGGTFTIDCAEGIEATAVQINGGDITINASDDGINATSKSSAYNVILQINDGNLTVNMGAGDTDALDTNGYLIINGGTVNLNGQFAFDYDTGAELNGGTLYVNGEQVTEITNSMMGGGRGGMGGQMGGRGQMPTDGTMPEGQMPTDGQMPEPPADGQMPQDGQGRGMGGGRGPRGQQNQQTGTEAQASTQA